MKKRRLKYSILLFAAVLVPVVVYGYMTETAQKKEKKSYTVILYQDAENEWSLLEEGAEQAKDDAGVIVNYIYLNENATAEDEISAIQKEVGLGTAGVLAACPDSGQMQKALKEAEITVPIVFVESGAGEDYLVIGADDYQMGKTLGEEVLEELSSAGGQILILGEGISRDSVKRRCQGVMEALEAADQEIEVKDETGRKPGDVADALVETLQEGGKVITLDKYSTEQAVTLWQEDPSHLQGKERRLQIYGIGNTTATVNALDNENLAALVYQNEFSMGYQGIMALVENREKDWIEENIHISYSIVTKETLYEEEHARLLFPNS